MKTQVFTFNPFQENTFVLYDETKECIIVDPGCSTASEEAELFAFIEREGLVPQRIVNTHNHIDHVFGITSVRQKYGVDFWCHPLEVDGLMRVPDYAPVYGFQVAPIAAPERTITEHDNIEFGQTVLDLRFAPGHSPGSLLLIHEASNTIIAGDVLFQGSIGRTDLPGGDFNTLMESIKNQLLTLPDHMQVYPGHGPATSIGVERTTNPFILQYISGN
ncbi:MAG: MBL fold metallo-hydrolase [Saprospiraceae bacterium]|nr:MBL fold metallo-hydrolase [Saprospiraceae bacterium]